MADCRLSFQGTQKHFSAALSPGCPQSLFVLPLSFGWLAGRLFCPLFCATSAPCLETFQLGASGFLLCYTCDLKWYLSLILPGLVGPVVPLVVPA